jgi:hypothetical protein
MMRKMLKSQIVIVILLLKLDELCAKKCIVFTVFV